MVPHRKVVILYFIVISLFISFAGINFKSVFFLSFVNKNAIFLHFSILSGAQWANPWITSPPTTSAANGHVNVSATANQLDAEENIPGSTTLAVLNFIQGEIKYRIKVNGNMTDLLKLCRS